MTLSEFKAWFEGYTENISKQPTQKQWARIQERVGEIDGESITKTVFIDRYWPQVTWTNPSHYGDQFWYYTTYQSGKPPESSFTSTSAMYALGQTEARQ